VLRRPVGAMRSTDRDVWRAHNAYVQYRAARLCHDSRELVAGARVSMKVSDSTIRRTLSTVAESRLLLTRLGSR
jgi:hypothetical protein